MAASTSAACCMQPSVRGACARLRGAGHRGVERAAAPPWTELETGLLARGLGAYGPDACRIARLLATRSCADVRVQLLAHGTGEPARAGDARGDPQAAGEVEGRPPHAGAAAPAPAARGPGNRRKPKEAPRRKHAAAKQARASKHSQSYHESLCLSCLHERHAAKHVC